MSPLESVRHDFLGSTLSRVYCDDKDCAKSDGAKILKEIFHGYGEKAPDLTFKEQQTLYEYAVDHLSSHPTHGVRIVIGHSHTPQIQP